MPTIDCVDDIEIAAPASLVYQVIADYPNWTRWFPAYHCEILEGDGVEVGARIHHQYGRKPMVLSDFVRVIDKMVPGERLEESYVEGDLIGTGIWEFTEEGSMTRAAYHCAVRSNRFMTHLAFLIAGQRGHSGVYQNLLQSLKAHCEALAQGRPGADADSADAGFDGGDGGGDDGG
ncbi:MAG: SRPBCC family protein [Pseudomonadota bacterium]